MAGNLKARLSRLRLSRGPDRPPDKVPPDAAPLDEALPDDAPPNDASEPLAGEGRASAKAPANVKDSGRASPLSPGVFSGWEKAGEGVLRRGLSLPLARPVPAALPENLPLVLPDLAGTGGTLSPGHILFFDLETTGLSGGAGTVAFLAAFGTFGKLPARGRKHSVLTVDQFLLLDYSGEIDFLNAVLGFINDSEFPGRYLTTYNGKSFDSQILKTRCLMNGFNPPKLPQLDLLYPARRMWKRILPNCSQATVETMALGLDRSGDTPGSLAPDIWFDFLKSGGSESAARRLLGICDHNVKDIQGLAALFAVFTHIAESPLDASAAFNCDTERLAMIWRRRLGRAGRLPLFRDADLLGLEKTSLSLLEAAARDYPRSCLRLGFDFFRKGRFEEGRAALTRIVEGGAWRVPCGPVVKAMALRSLAIDAVRRLSSAEKAAAFLKAALMLERPAGNAALPRSLREDLERRLQSLG